MQAKPSARPGKTLTFRLSCWVFLLMAFIQLLTVGVAMALRLDRSERIVVREVVRYLPQPSKPESASSAVSNTPPVIAPAGEGASGELSADSTRLNYLPVPPPPALEAPTIGDPLVAQLVAEAREARVAEDMRKAVTKLQEAESMSPDEPSLLYELGMAYEVMGIYDRAADYYQRVYEMGTTGAGSLYESAALKISQGFAQPEDQRGRLSLGRVRVFEDQRVEEGDRVVLTIPIYGVPGPDLEPNEIQVEVNFFDQDEKETILSAGPDATTEIKWLTEPVDWNGQGEELLRVTYTIPPASLQQAHLFGVRSYYGQVVELSYQGTLIDSQAWPRHLARKMNAPEAQPLFLPEDMMPLDYNSQNPLLPLPVR